MNIVFGGSFNPPTKAHKEIVDMLIKRFNPTNLIILPVGNVYGKADLAPFINRYEMLKIEFKDYKNVIISDIEKDKFIGTYGSLKILSKEYDDLYFAMGADNFAYLDKWINYKNLLKEFKFIIFNRNDYDLNSDLENKYKEYKDNFILIDYKNDISSSRFRNDKKYDDVDLNVLNYIKDLNLYKEE